MGAWGNKLLENDNAADVVWTFVGLTHEADKPLTNVPTLVENFWTALTRLIQGRRATKTDWLKEQVLQGEYCEAVLGIAEHLRQHGIDIPRVLRPYVKAAYEAALKEARDFRIPSKRKRELDLFATRVGL